MINKNPKSRKYTLSNDISRCVTKKCKREAFCARKLEVTNGGLYSACDFDCDKKGNNDNFINITKL